MVAAAGATNLQIGLFVSTVELQDAIGMLGIVYSRDLMRCYGREILQRPMEWHVMEVPLKTYAFQNRAVIAEDESIAPTLGTSAERIDLQYCPLHIVAQNVWKVTLVIPGAFSWLHRQPWTSSLWGSSKPWRYMKIMKIKRLGMTRNHCRGALALPSLDFEMGKPWMGSLGVSCRHVPPYKWD